MNMGEYHQLLVALTALITAVAGWLGGMKIAARRHRERGYAAAETEILVDDNGTGGITLRRMVREGFEDLGARTARLEIGQREIHNDLRSLWSAVNAEATALRRHESAEETEMREITGSVSKLRNDMDRTAQAVLAIGGRLGLPGGGTP